MADYYIIVDLGASNGRVMVADYQKEKFDLDVVHRFENIPVFSNEGEYFWDILRIFSDIKTGIQKAVKKYPNVRSLGIDTFGCDFGFIDKQGRLMGNPLHYRNPMQHELAEEMHQILSEEELFELSQGPCNRIMGIYKLYALKKMHAFEYEHGASLLMIPDILNYLLTGKATNEYTNATMTLMVNQKERRWEEQVCDKLDFRKDIFIPLTEPGTVLGPIKDSICKELEIPPVQVVIPATHDTASAVAGIPVVQSQSRWGFLSLGTWALAGLETEGPMTDEAVVPFQFGNEGGVFGKSMLLKNITGMWVIQQCRNYWNKESGRTIAWDEITKAANEAEKKNCFIDIDEPIFGEYHSNMPGKVQQYCRKHGQEVPEGIGEVARCVYQSLALKVCESFEQVMGILDEELELLQIVGGGTQNKLLCQWISNVMGIPVVAGPTETTAVGNLIFQLLADKKIQTLDEGRKLCAVSSELYRCEPQDRIYWNQVYQNYKNRHNCS